MYINTYHLSGKWHVFWILKRKENVDDGGMQLYDIHNYHLSENNI